MTTRNLLIALLALGGARRWPSAAAAPRTRTVAAPRPPRPATATKADALPGRLLDPGGRLRRDHPGFQKTAAGKGVDVQDVLRRLGRAEPRGRGRPEGRRRRRSRSSPTSTRLVDAGLVADDWSRRRRTRASSPRRSSSFIVRKGNPKDIKTWDDLLKPGVKVVTPNPFTSGAAKWNLLGAATPSTAGLDYVEKLIKDHVPVQAKSGREALQTFTGGKGDVLISYENEAIDGQQEGREGPRATSSPTTRS